MGRDYLDLSVEQLLDELARETRVPAGGPAAALTAAVASALVAMTARYARDEWADATTTVAQAEALRRRAVRLAQEDAAALEDVLTARETPIDPRSAVRDFHLCQTLGRAADAPFGIAETACDVAQLAAHVAERGDPEVRADAAAAALLAYGAARAAAHLVEVNLAAAADDERLRLVNRLVERAAEAAQAAAG
jgi:formiminotetrahydrofolate cyclodeaminase